MSNHDGSYMLNAVLKELEEYHFFKNIGQEKTHTFIMQIIGIGREYDCNDGEILDEIGERLQICYYCLEYVQDLEERMCKKCSNE